MKKFFPIILSGLLAAVLLSGCKGSVKESATAKKEHIITVDFSKEESEGISYKTITGAFSYVNSNPPASEEDRIVLEVCGGTYREYTSLTAPYITLRPADKRKDVCLTYYYGCGISYSSLSETPGTIDSCSTHICESAHDFIAENIHFENSYNIYVTQEEQADILPQTSPSPAERAAKPYFKKYQTQALALRVDADRSIFRNCKIVGRQDTLNFCNAARVYFDKCFIEGTADFIFGDGVAVFENCTINCPYNSGHVTASSTSGDNPFGYLFKDCSITKTPIEGVAAPADNDYTLGRPWRSAPQVIYWNCKMGSHITVGKNRYVGMTKEYPCDLCRFYECGTMDLDGNKLDLSTVMAPFEKEVTEEDMKEKYSPALHFRAKFNNETKQHEKEDNWNPF